MRKRDDTIDIIRGIAIFTMVASNLTPYALSGGSPYWFRFYGTFAAPLFVFIAGMMIKLAGQYRQHGFWYYLIRGSAVMAVGAGIDVFVWGLVPFLTVDVLYLIGLAMPLCYLLGKLPIVLQYVNTILLFAIMPFVQEWSSYRYAPDSFTIDSGITLTEAVSKVSLAQSWFVDGWFPIVPWLGVAFAGYLVGGVRIRYSTFANVKVLITGLCSLAIGSYWWQNQQVERFARGGYPDLFYPPTNSFFLVAAGILILLFYFVDCTATNRFHIPFKLYGRCSLLMYILHSAIIGLYFWPQSKNGVVYSFGKFFMIYLVFMIGLLLVAWAVSKIKPKELHPIIRFFIGS